MDALTKCEEIIMEIIWNAAEANEKEFSQLGIIEHLKSDRGLCWSSRAVSAFLKRLVKKHYLCVRRQKHMRWYLPQITRQEYLRYTATTENDF